MREIVYRESNRNILAYTKWKNYAKRYDCMHYWSFSGVLHFCLDFIIKKFYRLFC